MARKKTEPRFEESIARLEQIVSRLEDGEISLDESIRLFQEGRKLGKECAGRLADIEKKARLLIEHEDGTITSEPFEGENGEGGGEDEDGIEGDNETGDEDE